MNVTVDREHLKFEVTCHPTVVEDVVSHVLLPNVIGSEYPHWELKGICDRMRYQKAMLEKNPLYCLMEGVHQVCGLTVWRIYLFLIPQLCSL